MRVLEVGCGLRYGSTESGAFKSTQSFLDYDYVIWNAGKTSGEYFTANSFYNSDGVLSLKPVAASKLRSDIERRAAEVKDMMELGRTLVVWTPDPQACEIKVYRGGPRNQYEFVDLFKVLPFHTRTGAMSGSSIELRGGELFKPFWAQNQNNLRYEGQMLSPQGDPVFFVKGTDKIVGTHLKIGRGNVLFLPSLVESTSGPKQEQTERGYIESLTQLIENFRKPQPTLSCLRGAVIICFRRKANTCRTSESLRTSSEEHEPALMLKESESRTWSSINGFLQALGKPWSIE